MARQHRSVGGAQIGAEGRIALLRDPLGIGLLAEIELVVARHEHIQPDAVLDGDDMLPLVEPGHQRGREAVAGMAEQHRHAARRSALAMAATRAKPPRPFSSPIR